MITKKIVIHKLEQYFQREIPLSALVDWAETCMKDEMFEDQYFNEIRSVLARLGVADVREFGLTWEDCSQILDSLGYTAELLPQGTPLSGNFWESPTLDELALAQNIHPMSDVRKLFGTWPGDIEDNFEESIDILRHQEIPRNNLP